MIDARLSHTLGLLGVAALVVVSWEVSYVPLTSSLLRKRQHLIELRQRVSQIDQLLHYPGGQDAWLDRQRQILRTMMQRLPPGREAPRVLNELLAELARKHLETINVNQGDLEPAKDAGGKSLSLDGVACLRLPVTVTAEGRFRGVVDYVEQLKSAAFPCVVELEELEVSAKEPGEARLHIILHLALYFLGSR